MQRIARGIDGEGRIGKGMGPRREAYCRRGGEGRRKGRVEKLVRFLKLAVKHRYPALSSLDGNRIERALAERVADVKGVLRQNIPQTRQVLRKLIVGRIACTPFDDAQGRGYALAATGTYAGLFDENRQLSKVAEREVYNYP